jgi:pentose-5-phosphate-3-epimerase
VDTVADVVAAGADILVAGSAVFEHGNIRANARRLLDAALQVAA